MRPHKITLIVYILFLMAVLLSSLTGLAKKPINQVETRGHSDISFDVSPNGSRILFAAAGGGLRDIYSLQLRSGAVTPLIQSPKYEKDPAFSPDGKHIVYTVASAPNETTNLFIADTNGKNAKPCTKDTDVYDAMPSYSANGSQIVFARALRRRPYSMGGWRWDDWDIFTINKDGSQLKRMTSQKYNRLSSPRFRPDGKAILFAAEGTGGMTDLFSVDVSGRKPPTQLTQNQAADSDLDITGDGKQIVFVSDRAKSYAYELWQMQSDGTRPRQITQTNWYIKHPRILNTGATVFFLADATRSGRFLQYSLYKVNLRSGTPEMIANNRLFDAPLQWQSD